ncbi:hypothetical protein K9N68_37390 (plasmid) [Kovacikia minuta CCNUW1]|uniref:hypothetical protein n=1 Tax=Kovacikia minuta TaxID=2931930 RepID=UPI001CCD72F7|nr:hypothetical protein [Kovacikia minuta]UBF29888.1 hypothetical protein K9N68_37390 [Kovacikia minuta CCNUW1]
MNWRLGWYLIIFFDILLSLVGAAITTLFDWRAGWFFWTLGASLIVLVLWREWRLRKEAEWEFAYQVELEDAQERESELEEWNERVYQFEKKIQVKLEKCVTRGYCKLCLSRNKRLHEFPVNPEFHKPDCLISIVFGEANHASYLLWGIERKYDQEKEAS